MTKTKKKQEKEQPKKKRGAPNKSPDKLGINVMVRLPPTLLAQLDHRATRDGYSRSACIRALLTEGLDPTQELKLLTSWAENSIENTYDSIREGIPVEEARESILDSLVAVLEMKVMNPNVLESLEASLRRALLGDPVSMSADDLNRVVRQRLRKKGTLAFVLSQAKDAFGDLE